MSEIRQSLNSALIRKLLQSFLFVVVSLLFLFYGLLYWHHKSLTQKEAVFAFNQIVFQLENHLKREPIHSNTTLKQTVSLDDIDFQLILQTDDSQVLAITHQTHKHSNIGAKISLPQWNNIKAEEIHYKDGSLRAWKALSNNYKLYAKIYIPTLPLHFMGKSAPLWLLMLLLPLFIVGGFGFSLLRFLNHNYATWIKIQQEMLDMENHANYHPINITANHELTTLQHIFNRLNHRIHRQKNAVQKLQEHQQHVLDRSPDFIFTINTQQHFTYANQSLLNHFNLSSEQLSGLKPSDIVQVESKQKQLLLDQLSKEPKELRLLVKGHNSPKKYDLFINPIYNQHNNLAGFSGTLHDVTRDQSELEQLSLFQMEIDERLSSNEKLWAVMGHELRTPLNGMLGMIQLLEETALNEEQEDYVKTLRSSGDSMLFLLNDMLDLSKLDAGKMESVIENIDLLTMCREACELMIGNARKKDVELVFLADLDLPRFVVTDNFRLRQIFLNLLGNAFKFTQRGHVAFLVKKVTSDAEIFKTRYVQHQEGQQWLCFTITDTGPGIPADTQEQLFFFFNQANSSISRRFGGTGLGLAISKGLAEMLRGFIHLESDLGKGTTFNVYIPVKIQDTQPIYNYPSSLQGKNIQVFESNPLNRAYLNALLNRLGTNHQVSSHFRPQNLPELTASDKVSAPIMLIDYELIENQDIGPEFLEHPYFIQAKKLLISYRNQRSLPSRVLAHFDGFIEKPFYIEHLLAEILRTAQSPYAQHTLLAEQEDKKEEEKISFDDITVLLAEDNIVNQKVATKMLTKQGFNVIKAENGEIAVEKLKQHDNHIDLILMDCRMPKMNGLEATRLIRKLRYNLPIIALTANDTDEDRYACEEAGMDDFIAKPIKLDKLLSVIGNYAPMFKKKT